MKFQKNKVYGIRRQVTAEVFHIAELNKRATPEENRKGNFEFSVRCES